MLCLNCLSETENLKFCSKSCSTSYNNSLSPKRKPENKCKNCETKIKTRRKYCDNCFIFGSDLNLGYVIEKYSKHHKSSAFSLIRTRARAIAKKLGWFECNICNYNKHIEICHRKPISEFPLTALISEINAIENLICLCPNCHWEFDHNLI